ncbi:MAG: PKD domain-containing protein, partial [Balneolales bacterium]
PVSVLIPNFTYSCGEFTSSTTEVCFQELTSGGTPPYTYSWDFGDGGSSTAANPCHTYNSTTNVYDAVLTITDAEGTTASAILEVDLGNLFCPDPSVSISKSVDPFTYSHANEEITYTIVVSNTGNVDLFDIEVTDPLTGLDSTISTITVGNSATIIESYFITSGDLNLDSIQNIASVFTIYNGNPYEDEDTAVIYNEPLDIVAVNDTAGPVNGLNGATAVLNVFDNDSLGGQLLNPADVNLTELTPDPSGNLTLNPDGTVDVASNTPAGTYQLTYEICEDANPANCDQATVYVYVITCPSDANQTNDAGLCGAQVTLPGPAVGDGAGIDNITNDYNNTSDASDFYPVGNTNVVYTITTINGGQTTCSITVTVTDNEDPT